MIATILDLGTNTFNILIAEYEGNSYKILHKDKKNIKLGEKTISQGIISEEAIIRGINGLIEYKKTSEYYNSQHIYAIATSAIRSASNGLDFVARVKEATEIDILVIDGETEASLIQLGVKLSIPDVNEKFLIMDIGGGSTEFIISDNETIYWKESYDLGVARLFCRFQPSDPISPSDTLGILLYFDELLPELFHKIKEHNINLLVGSSGSFDTFAQIIIHKKNQDDDIECQKTYDYDINDFFSLHHEFITKNREDRLLMKGMIEMRVDFIAIASLFVNYILCKSEIKKLKLSTFALKEGVLYNLMNNIPLIETTN